MIPSPWRIILMMRTLYMWIKLGLVERITHMGKREGADFEIKARLPRTEGSAREANLKGWRLEP